jgi:Class III cytochrome C family
MPISAAHTGHPPEGVSDTGMPPLFALFALWLAADNPITLDQYGRQGTVAYDHEAHLKVPGDPQSVHAGPAASSCGGCHHTRDGKGVIQLAKCEGCHGPEGDPRNPKSRAFNEENRKTAFHEMCIGCHANLAKAPAGSPAVHTGPVACADCHQTTPRGKS